MKIKKRIFAFAVACAMTLPNIVQLTAAADEGEKYQYTMFGRNGITMNAGNLCMNGSMHTNKEAVITASNKNINGTVTTGSDIEKRVKHVYADQKIHDTYFTENCDLYEEEYVYSDINIHINNPLYCQDNISLDGNVSLNSSMGSLMDIHVTGEVKNANNSIVYSKYGNITIENDSTANINGLVYAPLGTLTINSPNINLNGVIIADQIVINGSSVNINGNDNIARFIGTTSEIYDFSGLEYLPEEWLGDSEADDLFDIYEKVIDSDPFNPHTDADELPDGYEVLTLNTDPLEVDTDEDGVWDCDEDFDCDNLSNLGEYQNQTDPFISDTDEDGLLDGDEIYTYGTIPTNPDTDGDSLLDGEEGYDGTLYADYGIYFDPLNPDTVGDGIWDGDEVFGQTKEQVVETHDEAITEVTVDMDTNGSLERNLSIESMYEIDAMTTNVYALVGEPFNFESATGFESATITFKIDQSKLGDTLFDNLIILWYNEEEQKFEEMPTTRDAANSTVSTTTTHFSQYMVVDSVKWYENWEESLSKLRDMWDDGSYYQRNMHTIFMVDCSSSMSSSDSCETIPVIGYKGVTAENIDDIKADINGDDDVESYCVNWSTRARVCYNIINNKASGDLGTVITFSGGIINDSGFSYRKAYLNSYLPEIRNVGGTANFNSALSRAQSYIDPNSTDLYRFIVITNNDLSYYNITTDMFADNVIFNIVNIGPGYMYSDITKIAQETGGSVYNTVTSGQLINQSGGYIYTPPQYIGTDFDEDGIPDLVELYGRLPNGQLLGTDPEKKDSDFDDIPDNVEFNYVHSFLTPDVTLAEYINAIKANSFPGVSDSDGDEVYDNQDESPLSKITEFDKENSQQLLDALDDYLNQSMPPIYDEYGNLITKDNAECGATWDYFEQNLWPLLLESGEAQIGQQYAAYTSWRRGTYGTTGIETIWVTSSEYINCYLEALCNELSDPDILSKISNQVLLGNYSEDITVSGTAGQIILGFSGIDFIADIRDVTYDVDHWEWSWSHAGQTGLDLIGVLPILGSLKNCDEFHELSKLSKVDSATELEKSISRIDELVKAGESESEIINAQRKYISEIVSSLKYNMSLQISEYLDSLPQNKIEHIINGSTSLNHTHNWEKLVPDKNWNDIKSHIINTMIEGTETLNGSAYMKVMYINSYRVEVTYNKIADTYKISDAWIRI